MNKGICPPDEELFTYFDNLVYADDAEGVSLFLNNLEKNFLSNKKIFVDENVDPLLFALGQDKYEAALEIIKTGKAPLNNKNEDGLTPLMLCTGIENEIAIELVTELLKGDCGLDYTNNLGETALIMACSWGGLRTDLKIASMLLDVKDGKNKNYPFILDNEGDSGLSFLFTFQDENHSVDKYIKNSNFIDLATKYIKIYYEQRPNDQILMDALEEICKDKRLYNAFERPLRNDVGIRLHDFCSEKVEAPEVAFLQGTRVDAVSPRTARASAIPRASRVPKRAGVIAVRDEVSPGGRFVNTSEEHLYVRQGSSGRGLKRRTHKKNKNIKTKRPQQRVKKTRHPAKKRNTRRKK